MGGVRTALYNYLFAKKNGGDFLLRIEDTDEKRLVRGATEYIIESLKWCGIEPNEGVGFGGDKGPYTQSERLKIYAPYAKKLLESGKAYMAFDTPEDLENMRVEAKKMGQANWQYNGVTRSSMKNSLSLPKEEVSRRLANGDPYTIRIKMPRNEEIRFEDEIRGWVTVNTNHLDDKVLFKEGGMPTYHLANVVDDHLMEITHVIRGEEWLPSAPLHIFLYAAFGWEPPRFAHLPLILRPDGNGKLSKRDGDRLGFPVFPINWTTAEGEIYSGYREGGYFPEAFINMLALLGWNPGGTQEIFSKKELCDLFSLDRVGKAGARFDPDKTRWFNQQYLRAKSNEELAASVIAKITAATGRTFSTEYVAAVCGLMKERATFALDIYNEGDYFFNDNLNFEADVLKKKWKENSAELAVELTAKLEAIGSFNAKEIEAAFSAFLAEKGLGFGQVGPVFRLLVTGKGAGPSMFEICEILGKETVIRRMKEGVSKISTIATGK
jgi:glutamyl-tRNA synthetase